MWRKCNNVHQIISFILWDFQETDVCLFFFTVSWNCRMKLCSSATCLCFFCLFKCKFGNIMAALSHLTRYVFQCPFFVWIIQNMEKWEWNKQTLYHYCFFMCIRHSWQLHRYLSLYYLFCMTCSFPSMHLYIYSSQPHCKEECLSYIVKHLIKHNFPVNKAEENEQKILVSVLISFHPIFQWLELGDLRSSHWVSVNYYGAHFCIVWLLSKLR